MRLLRRVDGHLPLRPLHPQPPTPATQRGDGLARALVDADRGRRRGLHGRVRQAVLDQLHQRLCAHLRRHLYRLQRDSGGLCGQGAGGAGHRGAVGVAQVQRIGARKRQLHQAMGVRWRQEPQEHHPLGGRRPARLGALSSARHGEGGPGGDGLRDAEPAQGGGDEPALPGPRALGLVGRVQRHRAGPLPGLRGAHGLLLARLVDRRGADRPARPGAEPAQEGLGGDRPGEDHRRPTAVRLRISLHQPAPSRLPNQPHLPHRPAAAISADPVLAGA